MSRCSTVVTPTRRQLHRVPKSIFIIAEIGLAVKPKDMTSPFFYRMRKFTSAKAVKLSDRHENSEQRYKKLPLNAVAYLQNTPVGVFLTGSNSRSLGLLQLPNQLN